MRQGNIVDDTKRNIYGEFVGLQQFMLRWNNAAKKQEITELFSDMGIDFESLKAEVISSSGTAARHVKSLNHYGNVIRQAR